MRGERPFRPVAQRLPEEHPRTDAELLAALESDDGSALGTLYDRLMLPREYRDSPKQTARVRAFCAGQAASDWLLRDFCRRLADPETNAIVRPCSGTSGGKET